jgi:hypothetical protein
MAYQQIIRETAERLDCVGVDPRHVEAWMRLEWGTLDARSRADFDRYNRETFDAHRMGVIDPADSERLACSYGL